MSGTDQRKRPSAAELYDLAESNGIALVEVEVRMLRPPGEILVRCLAPSGAWQYFWVTGKQIRLPAT